MRKWLVMVHTPHKLVVDKKGRDEALDAFLTLETKDAVGAGAAYAVESAGETNRVRDEFVTNRTCEVLWVHFFLFFFNKKYLADVEVSAEPCPLLPVWIQSCDVRVH